MRRWGAAVVPARNGGERIVRSDVSELWASELAPRGAMRRWQGTAGMAVWATLRQHHRWYPHPAAKRPPR